MKVAWQNEGQERHYKCCMGMSSTKRKPLFKPKDNIGTRANEYKLVMNKFRIEIGGRIPNNRIVMFCNCFPMRTEGTTTTTTKKTPKLLLRQSIMSF